MTILVAHGPPETFAVWTGVGTALAVGAYLLAIERTEEYAEQLRATIDLHRTKLQDVWTGTIPDTGLEHWFSDARIFVEHGRRALELEREDRLDQERSTVESDGGASPAQAQVKAGARAAAIEADQIDPASSDQPNGREEPGGSKAGQPLMGSKQTVAPKGQLLRRQEVGTIFTSAAAGICGRVRLLWIMSLLASVLILVGTLHLATRSIAVTVVTENVAAGGEIGTTVEYIRATDAPDSAIAGSNQPRLALRPLRAGDVVTELNSFSPNLTAQLTLPASPPVELSEPQVASVILAPCGLLLDRVFISPEGGSPNGNLHLALGSAHVERLAGCSPERMTVLVTSRS